MSPRPHDDADGYTDLEKQNLPPDVTTSTTIVDRVDRLRLRDADDAAMGDDNDEDSALTTTTTVTTVTEKENETSSPSPSSFSDVIVIPRATREMCFYCFDVLVHELLGGGTTKQQRQRDDFYDRIGSDRGRGQKNTFLCLPDSVECPLFVTWEKKKARPHRFLETAAADPVHHRHAPYALRGCIGTLSPRPLSKETLGEYALTSSLRDWRFDPITLSEVPELRVGVSLLVQYEDCLHVYDWEVGRHGILIKFQHPTRPRAGAGAGAGVGTGTGTGTGGTNDHHAVFSHQQNHQQSYSATYLPEIPQEQGWTREEAVESLVRKSGYRGSIDERLLQSIQCTRYQSSKCRVEYQTYVSAHCHEGRCPIERRNSAAGASRPSLTSTSAAGAVSGGDSARRKKSKWCLYL